jgi:hypothetical protein
MTTRKDFLVESMLQYFDDVVCHGYQHQHKVDRSIRMKIGSRMLEACGLIRRISNCRGSIWTATHRVVRDLGADAKLVQPRPASARLPMLPALSPGYSKWTTYREHSIRAVEQESPGYVVVQKSLLSLKRRGLLRRVRCDGVFRWRLTARGKRVSRQNEAV